MERPRRFRQLPVMSCLIGLAVGGWFGAAAEVQTHHGNAGGWVLAGMAGLALYTLIGVAIAALVVLAMRRWRALSRLIAWTVGVTAGTIAGAMLGPFPE